MNDDPNNAVSLYHEQDAMDDFPVLKAFQQYIDAEQSKARKRLVGLCVFFGLLMSGVVAVFVSLLIAAGEKNQKLNDKLVEYAMQERDRQPTTVQPQPGNDAALKVITDTLGTLQKQLAEQQSRNAALAEKLTKKTDGPTPEQIALRRQLDSDSEKIKKAKALLSAERTRLAAQKEELRKKEVEIQRRRLYPEYYGQTRAPEPPAKPAATPAPLAKPTTKAADRPLPKVGDKGGPINYFDSYRDDEPDAADKEMDALDDDPELKEMVRALPGRQPGSVPLKINGQDADWLLPAE